ncbi:MAG: hypothetical protein MZV49_08785 [Rhodopseudomonas palustris]|nr:hypothetical protein [Rhodopseudomonas palustris]
MAALGSISLLVGARRHLHDHDHRRAPSAPREIGVLHERASAARRQRPQGIFLGEAVAAGRARRPARRRDDRPRAGRRGRTPRWRCRRCP